MRVILPSPIFIHVSSTPCPHFSFFQYLPAAFELQLLERQYIRHVCVQQGTLFAAGHRSFLVFQILQTLQLHKRLGVGGL